jgi:AcrR family transcriptional regulator
MVYRDYMARPYHLKRRAERQDQTRQKIVEAALALHQTKGPTATTMADVAERAKVGRVTVYRHFPDEVALVRACSGQFFGRHPLPDLEPWQSVPDARERLRRGLRDTYAYHRATEAMMARILADAPDLPVLAPYYAYWRRAADVLAADWPVTGRHKTLLRAALALALDFHTWRTLTQAPGLTDKQAIELMERLTCDCPPLGPR